MCMESWSRERRWTLSALAALVVAAMLVSGWWVGQPRSTAGVPGDQGSVDRGDAEPRVAARDTGPRGGAMHPPAPGEARLVKGAVRVDSYVAIGNRLVLTYTAGVPECYGEVMLGSLSEGPRSVVVVLRAVRRVELAQTERCIDLAVTGYLSVELSAPLGNRSVLDGGFRPAVVVPAVPHPSRPTDCWPHIEREDARAAATR
jgi:hypothetical protein